MSILNNYLAALTSQMTYVNNETGDALKSRILLDPDVEGITEIQAEYFSDNFTVVAQQDTTASGFFAMVFQWRKTG